MDYLDCVFVRLRFFDNLLEKDLSIENLDVTLCGIEELCDDILQAFKCKILNKKSALKGKLEDSDE